MKVIFLDFDGVLNDNNYFDRAQEKIEKFKKDTNFEDNWYDDFDLCADKLMLHFDPEKLTLLKELTEATDSKIVIISSWREMIEYPFVEKRLKDYGLPIIGRTVDHNRDRGKGIRNYLKIHKEIDDYIILDDETREYQEEELRHLVKTDFFIEGLNKATQKEAIKRLKR